LFLDEPTTGIDVASARRIRQLITELHGRGTTIFLTTHYIEEAERLCQRISFIVKGRIVRTDTLAELLQPVQKQRAMLISVRKAGGELLGKLAAAFPDLQFQAVPAGQIRVVSPEEIGIGPLVRLIEEQGAELTEARRLRSSLEDVFVQITGIELNAMKKEKEKGGAGR
jgi:ABC-2 type transport system ATP-binding protein